MLDAIHQALEMKIKTPSSIITLEQNKENIIRKFKKFEDNIDLLNSNINSQNTQIDEHDQEASSLEEAINIISLFENKNLYDSYNKVIANCDEKKKN